MRIVAGDLIKMAKKGHFDYICHGCNCFHTMGKGIAKKMRNAFPECYEADILTGYGDINKLGTNSYAVHGRLVIANCYTQFNYGSYQEEGQLRRYEAIRTCLTELREVSEGKRVGIPKIGCTHGGGDWDIVLPIIEEIFADQKATIVIYGREPDKAKLPF